MSTTLQDLLDRVMSATGPDRELDAMLHAVVRDQRTVRENMHSQFGRQLLARNSRPPHDEYWLDHPAAVYPNYTASIDAALALVERQAGLRWFGIFANAVVQFGAAGTSGPEHLPRFVVAALLEFMIGEGS